MLHLTTTNQYSTLSNLLILLYTSTSLKLSISTFFHTQHISFRDHSNNSSQDTYLSLPYRVARPHMAGAHGGPYINKDSQPTGCLLNVL